MKPALQIVPIALLFAGAVVAVWRGMDPRDDRTPNRDRRSGTQGKPGASRDRSDKSSG